MIRSWGIVAIPMATASPSACALSLLKHPYSKYLSGGVLSFNFGDFALHAKALTALPTTVTVLDSSS